MRPACRRRIAHLFQYWRDVSLPETGQTSFPLLRREVARKTGERRLFARSDFDSPPANVSHLRQIARLKRIEREAEKLDVLQCQLVVIRDSGRAGFGVHPVGKWLAQRIDSAPGPEASFKQSYLVPRSRQFKRGRKPRQPGADDNHFLRRPRAPNPILPLSL